MSARIGVRRRLPRARGQASVLGALTLVGLLIFLLAIWGAATQWSDTITVEGIVRAAARAGALQVDRAAAASGLVQLDTATATARARQQLARGLALAFPPGRYQVLDAVGAATGARIDVYNATIDAPIVDPDPAGGGLSFHYATLCVSADIAIVLRGASGLRIPHHFHACAHSV